MRKCLVLKWIQWELALTCLKTLFTLPFLLQISTSFSPGNFQNFALVNRQRSTRIVTGFSVEIATDGTQLSYSRFGQLGQEALYWQLPENLQGDKVVFISTLAY